MLLGTVKQSERWLWNHPVGECGSRGLEQADSDLETQMKISKDGLRLLEYEEMSRVQPSYRKTPFSEVPQSIFPPEEP